MISMSHLWLPIVVSAIAVFVASSLLHMVLTYHHSDYRPLSNEDEVRAAITRGGATAGQYILPHGVGMQAMKDPVILKKMAEGPNGFIILRNPGLPSMGAALSQWFVYTLVLSGLTAYLASLAVAPGTARGAVFHFVGIIAVLGYAGALTQQSIWRSEPWAVTLKHTLDGVVYALVTGAVFALMWPAA